MFEIYHLLIGIINALVVFHRNFASSKQKKTITF